MTPQRIGHKGAAALAEGNTLRSFDAALAAGVDAIEFDVLSERPDGRGRLLLAHDPGDLRSRAPVELERALEHLAQRPFAQLDLYVDLKRPGYSERVVAALRAAGLLERALLCGTFSADLELARQTAPELRIGLTVPPQWAGYLVRAPLALPAWGLLAAYRRRLERRAAQLLQSGRFQAILAHWRLVTEALVLTVHSCAGAVYAWTVDQPTKIRELSEIGVDGIITNDPRLLEQPGATVNQRRRSPS